MKNKKVLAKNKHIFCHFKGECEFTNKCKLPESVIEDMQEAYRRSQEFLQTKLEEASSEEKLRQAFRKQLLLVAGFSQDEVKKMDISSMNDEDLQAIIRKRLLGEKANDCTTQKAVSMDDVESYLEQGWEFVATLPNGKVIVKLSQV